MLGASEAALALDEEITGEGLRQPDADAARPSPARTQSAAGPFKRVKATVLPGAYPGATIRRVSRRPAPVCDIGPDMLARECCLAVSFWSHLVL